MALTKMSLHVQNPTIITVIAAHLQLLLSVLTNPHLTPWRLDYQLIVREVLCGFFLFFFLLYKEGFCLFIGHSQWYLGGFLHLYASPLPTVPTLAPMFLFCFWTTTNIAQGLFLALPQKSLWAGSWDRMDAGDQIR